MTAWIESGAWFVVVASVVLIPCLVSATGQDAMRLPKDIAFIAAALLLGVVLIIAFAWRSAGLYTLKMRTVPVFAAIATVWTAAGCLVSSNRNLSLESLLWVTCASIFACAIDYVGRERSPIVFAWLLVPAIVNAVVFLLQRFHMWNPMTFEPLLPEHFRYTALIGNPDDVGSFFVAPALAAAALLLIDRRRRILWGAATVLCASAIAVGTLTPMVAFGAGVMVLGFRRSARFGVISSVLLLASAIVLVIAYAPLRERVIHVTDSLRRHDYAEAFSGRVTPFFAAGRMLIDHPIMGVGPGCFRWEYYPYKLSVEASHPQLLRAYAHLFNFGEVHNDHLQIAAETGAVGYGIFIASLFCIAATSFRSGSSEVARTLGFPLSVSLAVLCMAHFPLHLAAATIVFLYAATLCITESDLAELPLPSVSLAVTAPRRLHSAGLVAVGVAIALAMWGIRAWCYDPYVCNRIKRRSQQSTLAAFDAADQYRAASIAHTNLESLQPCLGRDPDDVAAYMLAAANYRVLSRFEDAARMYRMSLAYDRRPEIYYNLGIVELQLNQRAAAMADLLTAVRFSRTYMIDLPEDVKAELVELLRQRYPYLLGTYSTPQ